MVLVRYGSNDNSLKVWKKVDLIVFHSDCKHLHRRLQTAILITGNFLSLSDKESVIVKAVIPVNTLRNKTETKAVLNLTKPYLSHWSFDAP